MSTSLFLVTRRDLACFPHSALEGTAFVLPIEHAMRNKKNFAKVTIISGLSIGMMYMTFGLVGYLAFGSSVEAVITLNLKHRNPHDPTAVAVQLAYCVALVLGAWPDEAIHAPMNAIIAVIVHFQHTLIFSGRLSGIFFYRSKTL